MTPTRSPRSSVVRRRCCCRRSSSASCSTGSRKGSRLDRNVRELQSFLDNPYVTVLPVGLTTADRYARIAVSLRAKGRPIPSNDIWIAAHAMETGADLVSYDRHFEAVDGLAWVRVPASE